jgi:FkbM family methyltransferase
MPQTRSAFLRDVVKNWTPAPLVKARRKVLDWFDGPLAVWPLSGSSDRTGLIYDVGLCDGGDTAFYLAKGFRVVAIEANPALVRSARERFARHITAGWLTIVETAIGPTTGRVAFDVHTSNPHWSSIVPDRRERMIDAIQTIEVDCTTLDSVMREFGIPYYLKIDIEESDLDAIKSLKSISALPPYLSAEAHSREIAQTLFELGYRRFQLVDQREKNELRLWPWTWREGRYVWARFNDSHSGTFGREAPGRWLTIDEVLANFDAMRGAVPLFRGDPTWHDFHAAL